MNICIPIRQGCSPVLCYLRISRTKKQEIRIRVVNIAGQFRILLRIGYRSKAAFRCSISTMNSTIKFAVLAVVLCVTVLGDSSDLDDNSTVIYEEGIADESPMAEIDKIFTHSYFAIPGNGTCDEGIPCGYATFATSITIREIFVKSNCDCPEGTKCYLNALQSSAYVYRCSQSRIETDPILNEVSVPSEFPLPNNTRTLRSSSMSRTMKEL